MAHHKRKGPKSTRAGCLMCKPHKRQGAKPDAKERAARKAFRKILAGLNDAVAYANGDESRAARVHTSGWRVE